MNDEQQGEAPASPGDARLETPSIWLLALLPIVPILLLFQGIPLASVSTDPFDPAQVLRQVIMAGVWVIGLVLAYLDSRFLKSAGFVRPFGWLWALIGGGVYVIGRCIVVGRRNGGARRPMWVWIALAAFCVVFAIATAL
jgi:hypothetical protein